MRLLVLALALMMMTACGKKSKTNRELLTAAPWKLTALTTDPPILKNNTIITDWYSQLEACDKDNIYFYYTNDTYKADEGATKCNAGDPQNVSGNWAFLNNETDLRLVTNQFDTITYDLLILDESLLKMDFSGRDSANVLHTFTATFAH